MAALAGSPDKLHPVRVLSVFEDEIAILGLSIWACSHASSSLTPRL